MVCFHGGFFPTVAFEPFVQLELHNRGDYQGFGFLKEGLVPFCQGAVGEPFDPSTGVDQGH